MKQDVTDHLPLSPATLHVLLALTGGDLHGYGIMLEIARQSGGAYKMGPGTLYDNIKKLMKLGLVEESQAANEDEDVRREYRLKGLGGGGVGGETQGVGQG